ncbi:DUF3389 family protein [Shewanella gaetbuli]|uniref:DUF3389 domain-containing protein n=1 Tax=Shewanella gaetbuli TaxID=220752 RepID=A0A9X1ZS63_9GAMM|nr:DUF3389 family protein [Shewanella gaetbuli]MCL1143113.1 DUF3389 domain-containing protein [Shewanella gaetbuli]
MILTFSQGKIIITATEIQCRLNANHIIFIADVDDISCYHQGLVIAADAGTVKWSVKLDDAKQFDLFLQQTSIQAQ